MADNIHVLPTAKNLNKEASIALLDTLRQAAEGGGISAMGVVCVAADGSISTATIGVEEWWTHLAAGASMLHRDMIADDDPDDLSFG